MSRYRLDLLLQCSSLTIQKCNQLSTDNVASNYTGNLGAVRRSHTDLALRTSPLMQLYPDSQLFLTLEHNTVWQTPGSHDHSDAVSSIGFLLNESKSAASQWSTCKLSFQVRLMSHPASYLCSRIRFFLLAPLFHAQFKLVPAELRLKFMQGY